MREQIQSAALTASGFAAFRRAVASLINLIVYLTYPRAVKHYLLELGRLPNVALPATYNELRWAKSQLTNSALGPAALVWQGLRVG